MIKEIKKKVTVLPMNPGESVYRVTDDGEIEEEKVFSVGINSDDKLCIGEDQKMTIGPENRIFLSQADAEAFLAGNTDFGDRYEGLDMSRFTREELPYVPGDTFYYAGHDGFHGGGEIFTIRSTLISYDENGTIRIDDSEGIATLGVDPIFDTLQKAKRHVKEVYGRLIQVW